MKIVYARSYLNYGCNFHGSLAIIEHFERAEAISSKQPLAGFGRGACFDSLDEAKAMMNEKHPQYEILLEIPTLVVRLP